MSFIVEGKLHKVFPTESKTGTFQAREFILETEAGQYAQYIKFQLTQDRCQAIEHFKEGEMMRVHFDLRGREWNGKYFTNLQAWKLEAAGPQKEGQDAAPDVAASPYADMESDDLPF